MEIKDLFFLVAVLFLSPGFSFGVQEPDTVNLLEISVVSSRAQLKASETGKYISIIRAEQLENLPANTLDELLKYFPSVEVCSRGPFSVQSDLTIRGSSFAQVLVLIDGMRYNDPLTGHFNAYSPVHIHEIDRIEIYRGAAAAIFGPDAMGGVISIITKTFSREIDQEKGLNTSGKIWAGQHLLAGVSPGFSYQGKKIQLGGGLTWQESAGHEIHGDSRGDFKIRTFSGSMAYNPNDNWKIMARAASDFRDFNAKYFYTISPLDSSRESIETIYTQLQVLYQKDKSKYTMQAFYKSLNDSFLFNPSFPANIHASHLYGSNFDYYRYFSENFMLSAGIQVEERTISSTDRGNHDDLHLAFYSTLNFKWYNNLNLTTGLRTDFDENYGFEFLPQVNISWQQGKLTSRASAGRTIRAPDFTERYISTHLPGTLSSGRNLGNPDLKAERAWSFEAGADYYLSSYSALHLTLFRRYSDNLIDYVLTDAALIQSKVQLENNGQYFYASNIHDVMTTGIEFSGEMNVTFSPKSSVRLQSGITLMEHQTDMDSRSKYLSGRPLQIFNLNTTWKNQYFTVSLAGNWKRRNIFSEGIPAYEPENSYTIWDTRLQVPLLSGKIRPYMEVKNLFDKEYSDILGARMPGRWIIGGIRWQL
ncbi:MAG: TonB-dependent receptor plug domain-containing protein [Bacteroidota bacterium]